MYCLVLKQLSPIQKGIQAAHAIVEYGTEYGNTPEYGKWAETDKDIIVLDGGTSPQMEDIVTDLEICSVKFAVFHEPDLNGLLTAVCFITDEIVFSDMFSYLYEYEIPYRVDECFDEVTMADKCVRDIISTRHTSK